MIVALVIATMLHSEPKRVPNEGVKAFCIRLQKSNVTAIKFQGHGIAGTPPVGRFVRLEIKKSKDIKKILEAFKNSNRRIGTPEPGENVEIADEFSFVESKAGKTEMHFLYVVPYEIKYDWGTSVMDMYKFLRKKAK